ncbi:hypothetical protein IH575_02670, partial [Candidatus Dojkabacteria bacterium]|nr:hypothetical protein [Candidatus Dojkabacteria bacterium]
MELFDKGTVLVNSENGISEATYSIVDDSHIKLKFNSESTILEFQISADKLLLLDSQSTIELTKVPNNLFDNPFIQAMAYIIGVWFLFVILQGLYKIIRLQIARQAAKFELAYVEFHPIQCHAKKLVISKLKAHVDIQSHEKDFFEINISGSRGMCKRIQTSCKGGTLKVFEVLIDQDI